MAEEQETGNLADPLATETEVVEEKKPEIESTSPEAEASDGSQQDGGSQSEETAAESGEAETVDYKAQYEKLRPEADRRDARIKELEKERETNQMALEMARTQQQPTTQMPEDVEATLVAGLVEDGYQPDEAKGLAKTLKKSHEKLMQPVLRQIQGALRKTEVRGELADLGENYGDDWKNYKDAMRSILSVNPELAKIPGAAEAAYSMAKVKDLPNIEKAIREKVEQELAEKRKKLASAPGIPGEKSAATTAKETSDEDTLAAKLMLSSDTGSNLGDPLA